MNGRSKPNCREYGKADQPGTLNLYYILLIATAVFSSWILHEFGHFLLGNLLGYDMKMSLNRAYPLSGHYDNKWHYEIISAAGPQGN